MEPICPANSQVDTSIPAGGQPATAGGMPAAAAGQCVCKPGYTRTSDPSDPANEGNCAPCPRGAAKPELGNQMCSECSTGRVAQQTASTACKFCPAGSDGTMSTKFCTACAAGQYRMKQDDKKGTCLWTGTGGGTTSLYHPNIFTYAGFPILRLFNFLPVDSSFLLLLLLFFFWKIDQVTGVLVESTLCAMCPAGYVSEGKGNKMCRACAGGSEPEDETQPDKGCRACPSGKHRPDPDPTCVHSASDETVCPQTTCQNCKKF